MCCGGDVSVLFSEPKIPQSKEYVALVDNPRRFQCSSASRKFLNISKRISSISPVSVSVLFSEPKIPQYVSVISSGSRFPSFSALQRAENSSIAATGGNAIFRSRFSALQRAENSSIRRVAARLDDALRFSALQRAENSSMYPFLTIKKRGVRVSVLFSEPKIPQ